jgi:hypothetical protein
MKKIFICGLFFLWVLAVGCAAERSVDRDNGGAIRELSILAQKSGSHSHLRKKVRIVVYDRATLAQIPLPKIDVDFERQMVLIAGMGPTLRDDVGIQITRVWQEDRRIHVQERQIHPGLEARPSARPASPWTMVVVPKSKLNVMGYLPVIPKEVFSGD